MLTTVYATGIIQTSYPFYASEGWVLTDGRRGFLLTKYSQDGMEWALLDRVNVNDGRAGLRWGGFGIFQGDPERGAWLAPQESHRFGVTRITAFEGGIEEGFYAFRAEMDSRGHACPKRFNPPVHWNELYDNKLCWLPGMDLPENRKKYYTLADMREEAAKARDIGCEALYLDPGLGHSLCLQDLGRTATGQDEGFHGHAGAGVRTEPVPPHSSLRMVRSLILSTQPGPHEPDGTRVEGRSAAHRRNTWKRLALASKPWRGMAPVLHV